MNVIKEKYQEANSELETLILKRENLAKNAENRLFTAEEENIWNDLKSQVKEKRQTVEQLNERLLMNLGDEKTGSLFGGAAENVWKNTRGDVIRRTGKGETFSQRNFEPFNDWSLGRYMRAISDKRAPVEDKRAIGTGTTGGYLMPLNVWNTVLDKMRNTSSVGQAGVNFLQLPTGQNRMVGVATDPTLTWFEEHGTLSPVDFTFSKIDFQPKTAVCIVKVSRELFDDAINIEQALDLAGIGALNTAIESACFAGAGASGQPSGLSIYSGVNSFNLGAASGVELTRSNANALNYATGKILGAGGAPNAIIANADGWQSIADLSDTTGNALQLHKDITRMPIYCSPQITTEDDLTNIYIGDWTKLYFGFRVDPEIKFIENYYLEEYSHAFLIHMRFDVHPIHPGAFSIIKNVRPNASFA